MMNTSKGRRIRADYSVLLDPKAVGSSGIGLHPCEYPRPIILGTHLLIEQGTSN